MPSSSRRSVSALNSRPATRSSGSSSFSAPASLRAGSTPASSHSESPTSWPWALKNGKHIAPPIRIVSARSRNASSTPILSVTLAPPTTATSGRLGSSRMPLQRRDLALEQPARRARQQVRDGLGGGVRAVGGAERVVDVDVGERRRSAAPAPGRSSSRPPRSGRSRASRRRRRGRRRGPARARRRSPSSSPSRSAAGRSENFSARGPWAGRGARPAAAARPSRAAPSASAAPPGCARRR